MKKNIKILLPVLVVIVLLTIFFAVTLNAASSSHEAEDSNNNLKYASNKGDYVEFDNKKDAYVEMKKVNSPSSGSVTITFVYSSNSDVPVEVKINGDTIASKETFKSTGGAWKEKSFTADMKSGTDNKVKFKIKSAVSGVKLDKILISTDGSSSSSSSSSSSTSSSSTSSSSSGSSTSTDNEVVKSGSTWTANVKGSKVYSGSRMFDAVNAACNKAGKGATIKIKSSGKSGNDGGNVYAIKPLEGQTLDFGGNTVNCNSNGDLAVAVYAKNKNDLTIKNLKVTGNPRYGVWFLGCSNLTITNITMDLSNDSPVGLGIRVEGKDRATKNLKINGTIKINGSKGHGIETYTIDGVDIGDVSVTNTGGCGVLLNDSKNCNIGVVRGDKNCQNGGYATFRVANTNGKTHCKGVYSRNSGRGFFSVTDSKDCTIDWVDIKNTKSQCILLQNCKNTKIKSGTVSNGNPNIQHVSCSNVETKVNGKTYSSSDGKW